MKTSDILKILNKVSKILAMLPEGEIEESLEYLIKNLSKQDIKRQNKEVTKQDSNEQELSNIVETLKSVDLDKADEVLREKYINRLSILKQIANKLNISTTGRPRKEDLIHTILKTLERERLDKTIRSGSTDVNEGCENTG